jgi:hypothetical protein
MSEQKCKCGDLESQHIDNEGPCVIPECGCKEFENACDECGGEGYVTIGQYDDLKEVRCPFCNPKTEQE